jgi:hypothetical protein
MKNSNAFIKVKKNLRTVLQLIFSLILTPDVIFKFSFICFFAEVLLQQKPSENK